MLFRELTSHYIFHECDVIDLSTEQMCGRLAMHDVIQHSVTFEGCSERGGGASLPSRDREFRALIDCCRVTRGHRGAATLH